MGKTIMKWGVLISVILILIGCRKEKKDIPKNLKEEVVVGFSMGTLMEDRWVRDRDIFLAKAKQEGIKVIVNNANRDSDLQYQQVLEMLEQGIDILVIAPNDSISEVKCVEAAKDKGIPVISYDRLVMDADVDLYISFDNKKVGEAMAQELVKSAPEGGYLVIGGPKTDNNTKLIYEGAMNILKPFIEEDKINILGETWIEEWTREGAYQYATEQINAFGDDIKAIICGNDSLAWGVIDALSEAQMTDSIFVSGQDADLVACQRVVTGKQTMTIYKPIPTLVDKTVESCLKLINGEDIPSKVTSKNGKYEIPSILLDVIPVTKDNMDDTVIKDGFHLAEDIYKIEN